MGQLTNSASAGLNEVLETLHYQGALTSGVQLFRIGDLVSKRYHGDENRMGSDAQFEADTLTVLGQLQDAGYVIGRDQLTGATVDLKASPAASTRVVLTGSGREHSRHLRPRPRRLT